jgi:spermidine synthase
MESMLKVVCLKFLVWSILYTQVLKHEGVEHVDHVDLDEDVIETCETFFPQWGDAWKDPRAELHIKDGAQFVRDAPNDWYDVIIQDSSDPWNMEADGTATPLPSSVLYEEDHICQLQRILKSNGILNLQVRINPFELCSFT